MDKQAIQHVLDRYYTVVNSHDRDGIAEIVSADVVFDDDMVPGTVFRGVDEFRGVFDGMWYAFPDLRFEVLRGPFFADGAAQCAVYGQLTGTLANAVPDFGFTRIGATARQEFMALYEIAGERISYIRACLNPAILASQVGASAS
jgi:predicted ester cyclase